MGTKKGGVEGESCFVLDGSPGKGVAVTDTVWNRCDDPMVTRSDSARCRTLKMAPAPTGYGGRTAGHKKCWASK